MAVGLLLLGFKIVGSSPSWDRRVGKPAGGLLPGLFALTRPEFLVLPAVVLLLESGPSRRL